MSNKVAPKAYNTMKTQIRHSGSAKESTPPNATPGIAPTPEQIRQRAHEIFLARGAAPGQDLDDWLRAEQELKQGHAVANSGTIQ